MRVALYTEHLPTPFHWNPSAPWRGTEEFYVETARWLGLFGHDVTVFYDGPEVRTGSGYVDGAILPGASPGVTFSPRASYKGGFDVVLCCNTSPPGLVPGTKHVYWSNLYGDRWERHLWADEQIVISDFHRSTYEAPSEGEPFRTHVVGHGVYPEQFAGGVKERLALYSSSMDRGGYWLQANWTSFGTGLPLVCTDGKLSNDEVRDLYKRASVWVHPAMGVELFCISALKAQAAGCLCVYSPTMALPETIREGHLPLALISWRKKLAESLKNKTAPPVPTDLPTWSEATRKIEALLCS